MRQPRRGRVWGTLACLVAAACGAPGPADPGGRPRGTPTRLTPSAIGSPLGGAQPVVVGPAGGSVASLDGRLTVTVPAGAVPGPVTFTVQEITNTAPGAVGSAYRLGPGGVTFALPVTLTFTPGGGAALAGLTVATQDGRDFWLRYRDVARDLAAGTLALTATHLGDWAVVAANTASDLRGRFTLHSTLDLSFDATGDATLNYGGDDADGTHFLQWGTLTLGAPVVMGSATCTPTAPTWSLLVNVADLTTRPGKFDWGVSGIWPLDCRDADGTPSSSSIVTAFDTFGIDHLGCARGYAGTPTFSLTEVSGTYLIDCGPRGQLTAQFQFRNCLAGAACASTDACRTASLSCAGTYAACVDDGDQPGGTACPGGVCSGTGVCNACLAGQGCPSASGECGTAAIACSSGAPICTEGGPRGPGEPCSGGVCSGLGTCTPCPAGQGCPSTAGECGTAAIACASGAPLCAEGPPQAPGTPCTGGVCSGAGACVPCLAGASCGTGAAECSSAIACSSGAPVCAAGVNQPAGAPCSGGVCSGTGVCNACLAGQACLIDGDPCAVATAVCSSGALVCTRTGSLSDGTACGAGRSCDAGACVASSAVTGTRLVTFWPEAGALPPALPADAGAVSVKALVPDGLGGYRAYPGAFDAAGAFAIPNVPDGASYWLVLTEASGVERAVQTSARIVDLGFDRLGRPGAALPTVATPVPLSVDGLVAAWRATDLLQLVSSNADLVDAPPTGSFAAGAASGSTTEDWRQSGSGGALPLLAAEDTLLLHHLASGAATTTGGGAPFLFHAVSSAAAVTGLALADGNPVPSASIAATLSAPAASASLSPDWRTTQFEALAPGLAPAGTADAGAHTLRISASAGPLSSPSPLAARGTPDLFRMVAAAGSGDLPFGPLGYGRPLPAPLWNEWQEVEFAVTVSYTLPPATVAVSALAAVGQREPLAGPPVSPIAPLLSPVKAPRVGVASLLGAPLTGVGATPTISWTAPALGVPTSYLLEIFALGVSGAATTSALVASFTTTGTQVVLPPGVLAAGTTCFARITARAAPGDAPATAPDRTSGLGAYAGTLTATFTP